MPPLLSAAQCLPAATAGIRAMARGEGFPPFLPEEVRRIRDKPALELAKRIERISVQTTFSKKPILSSCVRPLKEQMAEPIVLLHGFDSSVLEWRYAYPLLEAAGAETWAIDVLGWGFSELEILPPCDVTAKRQHLYALWRSYIKRPMVLVGPSLGAAVAIDFAANHPEAVSKLIFIDASVYAEGPGRMTKLPKFFAYGGVYVLKSFPLRFFANTLCFRRIPNGSYIDWTNIGRLHCLLPWWEDATVDFMRSGGYNVINQIKQIKQKSLIIWGEEDKIISKDLALKLHNELPSSNLQFIPQCGHIPHIEKPDVTADLILDFIGHGEAVEWQLQAVLTSRG